MARIDVMTIYSLCKVCWGTGVTSETTPTGNPDSPAQVNEIICPNCNGDKLVFGGYVTSGVTQILDPEVPVP